MSAATATRRGPLIIISGPSGTGKTTLVQKLLATSRHPLRLSVSATTRSPRIGEQEGVHYYFWTRPQFEAALARGEFLEHALVHGDHYYGTLAREVEPFRQQGVGVILDIDVQGARQVWAKVPDHLSVFVRAGSLAAYEDRLRKRGTETEASIQRRLADAESELSHSADYPYQILNDDLDEAVSRFAEIVDSSFS